MNVRAENPCCGGDLMSVRANIKVRFEQPNQLSGRVFTLRKNQSANDRFYGQS